MLKDMTVQLQKEQDVDNEAMEKMKCWCETYDKEKTQAILDGEDKIAQLKVTSQAEGAAVLQRTQEIAALNAQLAQATGALASATEQRKKELAEFNAEEKDLLASITSVKDAIISLSKHHGASFLQESGGKDESHKIAVMIQMQLRKHENLLAEIITPHQRKLVAALLQENRGASLMQSPEDYFAAVASVGVHLPSSMRKFMPNKELSLVNQVPGGKYYQSASGEIFGILKQLKESFEENLKSAQVQETASNAAFEDLKAAKTAEIAATKASLGEKQQLLGEASFNRAKADQDTEDSEEILAADTEYLKNLKGTCATADADFSLRTQTRIEETQAVSKALGFLNSDDAQDLFHKNFGGAVLLQKSKRIKKSRQAAASRALSYAGHKLQRPELSALAVKVRIDAFTKAKKQIQTMIEQLQKETADEIKKKDTCISEINSNEASQEASVRDRDEAIEKVEALTATIDKLAGEIAELKKQVADSQTALKRASEDREIENHDFQLTIADQRATQKVLTAALNALAGFYNKASLAQKSANGQPLAGPPPPPAFKPYKKQGSGGVMGVIESVISESKTMEADAIRAEEDAQLAYENLTKETNDSVDEMIRSITTKSEFKAQSESDRVETEQSRDTSLSTLESLASESAALHADCDYTLKNFDLRQTARGQEVEALKQALVFLSGGSFKALLQGEDVTPQMQQNDEIREHDVDYRNRLQKSLDDFEA